MSEESQAFDAQLRKKNRRCRMCGEGKDVCSCLWHEDFPDDYNLVRDDKNDKV